MSGSEFGLALAVFLACAVEAVEALTIVLAVGVTRDWRSALTGAGAALGCLAIVVGALGPAVTQIPLGPLRVVVGGLLLIFGLGWLRKAILRAAGRKAKHDETAIYAREQARAREAGDGVGRRALDGYALATAFKGVLLEGLEVAFIVVTFGSGQHRVTLAAGAALAAVVAVTLAGVLLHRPLVRVPENAMKFSVGVLLCSFGAFWSTEGAGGHWPGGDAALLVIVPGLALVSVLLVRHLRAGTPATA